MIYNNPMFIVKKLLKRRISVSSALLFIAGSAFCGLSANAFDGYYPPESRCATLTHEACFASGIPSRAVSSVMIEQSKFANFNFAESVRQVLFPSNDFKVASFLAKVYRHPEMPFGQILQRFSLSPASDDIPLYISSHTLRL